MKIKKKLKEDETNHTSNEIAIKSNSAEETQFYGIFEEIFLAVPAWLENLKTDLWMI